MNDLFVDNNKRTLNKLGFLKARQLQLSSELCKEGLCLGFFRRSKPPLSAPHCDRSCSFNLRSIEFTLRKTQA